MNIVVRHGAFPRASRIATLVKKQESFDQVEHSFAAVEFYFIQFGPRRHPDPATMPRDSTRADLIELMFFS
jgi:hypothetical protein